MTKAYSYIRFSSKKQEKGDSVRRQEELSKRYCDKNNLILDDSLKVDDGISAFKGDNKHFGALNNFLQKIKNGDVSKGSYFLIEALDRLSREGMWPASDLMRHIVDSGVNVVTLTDNKCYTSSNINDVGTAFQMMIGFAVANEESEKKSKRTLATWVNKQELAVQNKMPKTAMIPWWLELDKSSNTFKLKLNETNIVKDIFEKYCAGFGRLRLAKYLNDTYPTIQHANKRIPKMWYDSSVNYVLLNEAVIGNHTYKEPKSEKNITINGYFPPAIPIELWAESKNVRKSKHKTFTGGKQPLKNIFSHIIFCGECGGSLMRASNTDKNKGLIYKFSCQNGRAGKTSCGSKGWLYDDVETKLLKHLTEVDFSSILGNKDNTLVTLKSAIQLTEHNLIENGKQRQNISGAIARRPDYDTLMDTLDVLESQKKQLESDLEELRKKYENESNKRFNALNVQKNLQNLHSILNIGINRQIVNTELKKVIDKIILNIAEKNSEIHYKNSNVKYSLKHHALLLIDKNSDDRFKIVINNTKGRIIFTEDDRILGIELEDGTFGLPAYNDTGSLIGLTSNGVITPFNSENG